MWMHEYIKHEIYITRSYTGIILLIEFWFITQNFVTSERVIVLLLRPELI